MPDLSYYEEKDQFYIDYQEMPGVIVTEEKNLCPAVRDATENFDYEKLIRFRKQYMCSCDGHAMERLIDYLHL